MIKFFTLPPRTIPYPYILINANNPRPGLRYIYMHHHFIDSVIIDSGIEIFRKPDVKDYPANIFSRLVYLYKHIRRYVSDVLVTIPDYPDDYNPRGLWIDENITNIERTYNNVLYAIDNYPRVAWLIPVQGHNRKPKSILRAIRLYRDAGIINRYKYYAIANLCIENNVNIIRDTLKLARSELKDKYIHAFGINLRSIRYVHRYINSFDSMAWTRPVSKRKLNANYSAKNLKQREQFFLAWLERLHSIISNADIYSYF